MSLRKRTSCRFPRLITAELLDELHAVAVRVEHVEKPHLVVELEDGADVDVLGAKPLRLRLGIVDVDRRYSPVLRLSLCQRDLHVAPLELRPTSLVVEVRLGEAELVRVERSRGGQVAYAVPDPHGPILEREARFFE